MLPLRPRDAECSAHLAHKSIAQHSALVLCELIKTAYCPCSEPA